MKKCKQMLKLIEKNLITIIKHDKTVTQFAIDL